MWDYCVVLRAPSFGVIYHPFQCSMGGAEIAGGPGSPSDSPSPFPEARTLEGVS